MIQVFGVLAALFAFVGTGLQAYVSMKQLKEIDPEGHLAFFAVDDLKTEFSSWRQPKRWLEQRKEVDGLMKASPEEARLYRRVRSQITAWALLMMASALLVITSLGALVAA